MPPTEQTIRTYQELANRHEKRGDAPLRDRFLVLAADAALAAGRKDDAERLRARLLQANPHHILKPYRSLAEAMKSPDVLRYIDGLRRNYPPEKAAQLLEALPPAGAASSPPPAQPVAPPSAKPAQPAPPNARGAGIYDFQDDRRPAARPAAPRSAARAGVAAAARGPGLRNEGSLWPPPGAAVGRDGSWDMDTLDLPPGAWLPTLLFWLVLLGSVGGAAFVAGQPFFPTQHETRTAPHP